MIRPGVLFFMLLMLTGMHMAYAASSTGQLHVSAYAVATLSFRLVDEPHYYRIEESRHDHDTDDHEQNRHDEHADKNYTRKLAVKEHVEIAVTSNNRAGYALVIKAVKSGPYQTARIRIRGHEDIYLQPGQSTQVSFRGFVRKTVITKLKVKLISGPDARPGKYLWPINISAIPL